MKKIIKLAVLFCFFFAIFQIPAIISNAQIPENPRSTLRYGSQLDTYFYSDDFSTRKAEMDSYDHSKFFDDTLSFITRDGFLVYIDNQTLGFFKGSDGDVYGYLRYKFPLEEKLGIVKSGTLKVDVLVEGDKSILFLDNSCDGKVWDSLDTITDSSGHYEYVLVPEEPCTSLFLMFSGDMVFLDNFSLSLTFSDPSNIDSQDSESQWNLKLSQNYPNPFNPKTYIEFSLSKACDVKIDIYNICGQKIKTLVDQYFREGHNVVDWDGRDDSKNEVASGIYFYKLSAGELSQTKKMILLR